MIRSLAARGSLQIYFVCSRHGSSGHRTSGWQNPLQAASIASCLLITSAAGASSMLFRAPPGGPWCCRSYSSRRYCLPTKSLASASCWPPSISSSASLTSLIMHSYDPVSSYGHPSHGVFVEQCRSPSIMVCLSMLTPLILPSLHLLRTHPCIRR